VTIQTITAAAHAAFRAHFDAEPATIAWAPGRLELLGNHTDYNRGHVLSVALDLGIAIAADRSLQRPPRLRAWSEALGEAAEAALDPLEHGTRRWLDYSLGVLREIAASGVQLPSLCFAIASSLPLGAGVSSSAALELATAEAAFALAGGRPADPLDEAKLCQRAETDFVGVPCGLLDQFSSLFGRQDHALWLDCATLDFERCPLGAQHALLIADTQVKHALVDGRYARLRRHCDDAARRLGALLGREVPSLRDVRLDEFLTLAARLDDGDRRRAEHVLRENARVLEGRDALRRGEVGRLGELMVASHESSRDLFGNSVPELDRSIEIARRLRGFVGAKLTGGGFGGATAHLVERASVERYQRELTTAYDREHERPLCVFVTSAGEGARVVPL